MKARYKIIIVADHDTASLMSAKSLLSGEIYDVLAVPSGKTLLLLLENVTPDMILLDIEMPDIGAHEITKALKSSGKTNNIPIILLSTGPDPGPEERWMGMGAVDCLIKPLTRELLEKRIETHIYP